MNKNLFIGLLLIGSLAQGSEADHNHEGEDHHEEKTDSGFKLTPEAFKNFGLKLATYGSSPLTVPVTAVFFGLEEVNVYRLRDGNYQRIDFKTHSKSKTEYVISSADLRPGDQIVTSGLGFLRIAEIAASGGLAEGHSH